jgi:ATP-dependent protease ClpP protease subunit
MKEVFIEGDIGYRYWDDSGVTAKTVKEQLNGLEDGEEISITINSPGGSVYDGVVIFNLIRDYAKTHPVSARINCIAMSMASYIALAARTVDKNAKVTVSENSVMMIHNPWGYTWGDYREFRKTANYFEKLSAMYGSVHAAVSGKTEKEIRAAMDDETYYVGKEIEEAGFANVYEEISSTETKETAADNESASAREILIINAQSAHIKTMEKAREAKTKNPAAYNSDLEKAVALFVAPKLPAAWGPKPGEKITTDLGGSMTPEELLAKDKSLYDAVFALGEKAGLEKERARASAHLLLGEKTGALSIAAKYIKSGVSTSDETAQAEYYAANLDHLHITNRNSDDIGDLHTEEGGGKGAGGGSDDAKLAAAFENGYAGKNTEGKSWAE